MPNDELNGSSVEVSEHCVDVSKLEKEGDVGNMGKEKEGGGQSSENSSADEGASKEHTVIPITVVVEPRRSVGSNGVSVNPVSVISEPKGSVLKKDERVDLFPIPKKGCLLRNESSHEQCRVCQQQMEEPLIDLGCQCRGGLAKAHRSCIDTWFRTRGSNRCEICQQVATNVQPPESQQSRNYWVWRIDPNIRRTGIALEHERGCYGPLWVAFSILIGGLLLDVLISISLGVSALPQINCSINDMQGFIVLFAGVLVVLGLGTALRLALECCHEITLRRAATQSMDATITLTPLGYHPPFYQTTFL